MSPQRAVLSQNLESELERLYADHVAPPSYRPRGAAEAADTRAGIHARASEFFRRRGIFDRLDKRVRAAEYTFSGDPLRIDFGYRVNGTRGFVHAVALGRDPRHAKEFAFTAERVRARVADCRFAAITETEPRGDNERHQFVSQVLAEQKIEIVPVPKLDEFTNRLRPLLQ